MRKAIWSVAALVLAVLALALVLGSGHRRAQAACTVGTVCVTSVADHAIDACDAECTLRDALGAVQASQTIAFSIPGGGPHTITLNPALGELTIIPNAVTINGYAQPGSQANTVANTPTELKPGNADIRIVLNGSGTLAYGLWVKGSNALIQGLSIVNFQDKGIFVSTFAASASIQGNYIGVFPDGQTAGANGTGILVRSSEPGNLIGGSQPAQRNVISGNAGAGISVTGLSAIAIAGNFVGTNSGGTSAVPNGGPGISMAGGRGSMIGGNGTTPANLISGNAGHGIAISTTDGSDMNIRGNRIGVKGDGISPLPNGGSGVLLDQGAEDNTIGGEINAGEWNTIAYNVGAGVALTNSASFDNYIDPNLMFSNVGLGADLQNDGLPLANDPGDGDGGNSGGSEFANRLMNYPVINSATYDIATSKLTVNGTLDSVPGDFYNMFFFWNEECDPSGYGEGHHFLGSAGVGNGATMPHQFSRVDTEPLAGTVYLVMQASDPSSSSEFSPCYALEIPATPSPSISNTPAPTATPTPTQIPTPTPTPTPTHTPTPTPTPTSPPSPKQGDMNCDDEITMQDFSQFMNYLVTGERGPAPDTCPSPGQWVGQTVFQFMDTDCSFNPTPGPGTTPPSTDITPKDALVLLIAIAGIDQNIPGPCPEPGERFS